MRVPTVIATASLILVAVAATACSSGSKSTTGDASTAKGTPSTAITAAASTATGTSSDVNACSFLTPAQVSSMTATKYTSAKSSRPATGQDFCTYKNTGSTGNLGDLIVIIYQADSGVSFGTLIGTTGADKNVSGVGDKARAGDIELDVLTGDKILAVQNAGTGAVAVAKAVIAAMH
jgi:hypothetical protein